ncbi:MAG TPA: GAF domain-containing protein, partial [Pyrinomonadaceae bacterium]|nr:GAF domain-containing protein [Pyrinomonadaceae bacterium]
MLDVVAETAARLCDAGDSFIFRPEGDGLRIVAHFGSVPPANLVYPFSRRFPAGRAVLDCQTIHIHDSLSGETEREYPGISVLARRSGVRTALNVPLLRAGVAIGCIAIRRTEVRSFTDKQIALLKTFASQAVIAIENVRLFQELKESLEQQTATSEILRVIASSPTDIQPVLETIAEYAAKVTESEDAVIYHVDGNALRRAAKYGPLPWGPIGEIGQVLSRGTIAGRAVIDRQTVHVPDMEGEGFKSEFPDARRRMQYGIRSSVATPLFREGIPVGVIYVGRKKLQPFTEKQIALLKTFADQAVIAIENVRLFQELQARNRDLTEALEQQTATSEVLRVIASSATELQPVLDTVIANAVTLAGAKQGHIRQYDGEFLRVVAHYNETAEQMAKLQATPTRPGLESLTGRAFLERKAQHILDAQAERQDEQLFYQLQIHNRELGMRTLLVVPLLREGAAIGTISIWRDYVEPFSERQIELVKTFAHQAVIAIENVRLFRELETRTRELAQSVGELKALGEVGQAVSSTLDLQTVLSAIVRHAVELSGTSCGIIFDYDELTQEFRLRASYKMEEELVEAYRATPLRLGQGSTGKAAATRTPVEVVNLLDEREPRYTRIGPLLARLGYQSLLAVPFLLEQRIMGALTVYRRVAGSFASEVVNLLQTFATQSVLAIQNARLFREIEEKSRQIEAA